MGFSLVERAAWNCSEISKGNIRLNYYLLKSTVVAALVGDFFSASTQP